MQLQIVCVLHAHLSQQPLSATLLNISKTITAVAHVYLKIHDLVSRSETLECIKLWGVGKADRVLLAIVQSLMRLSLS